MARVLLALIATLLVACIVVEAVGTAAKASADGMPTAYRRGVKKGIKYATLVCKHYSTPSTKMITHSLSLALSRSLSDTLGIAM
jgi:hypothetical protein